MLKKIIAVCLALTILAGAQHADAQLKADHRLFSGHMAYALTKSDLTGETMDGWGLGFALEQTTWDGMWVLGLAFTYEKFREERELTTTTITTMPWYLTGKFLLGDPTKLSAYVGGGLGLHISTKQSSTEGQDFGSEGKSGLALALPIGLYWFIDEGFAVQANYTLNYFGGSYFKNDIVHMFVLGIAFQFGGHDG
jgi:opacity protein-like surface antigen